MTGTPQVLFIQGGGAGGAVRIKGPRPVTRP